MMGMMGIPALLGSPGHMHEFQQHQTGAGFAADGTSQGRRPITGEGAGAAAKLEPGAWVPGRMRIPGPRRPALHCWHHLVGTAGDKSWD